MFYYLSFLRPPPLSGPLSGPISITPQIANDLRTESLERAQDIYYSWSPPQDNTSPSKSAPPSITKPVKLTTWRQSSAYKELLVPLPPGVRDGQPWRLVLTSHVHGRPHVISLKDNDFGHTPFPVMSMPIIFNSRHPKTLVTGKQEQIERIYGFPLKSKEDNTYLTVREQTSYDLDKKIWDSGIGLSSWILDLYDGNTNALKNHPRLNDALFSHDRRNILELGAGTGIVTLTIASLRSSFDLLDVGKIITTDLPSAMPLLEHNISANEHLFTSARPQAAVLNWDDEEIAEVIKSLDAGIDAIVMADVTYNTTSFPSLIRTLSSLIQVNVKRNADPPVILLGYKERDPEERTLWKMAGDIGLTFERVGERVGSGGNEVEVWVGKVTEDG